MARALFLLCTVWVVLFNNSHIAEQLPTYSVLRFFPVPRQARFVEVVAILILFVGSLRLPKSPLVRRVNVLTLLFLAVAFIGLLPGLRFASDRVQEIYIRVVPLMIFVVAATLGVTRQHLRAMGVVFLIAFALSVVTAVVYQIPFHGWHEDHIHGLFSDAHIMGCMVAIGAVASLSEYLETRRPRYALAAVALFFFQFYPRNGKLILLTASWFGIVLVKEYVLTRGWVARLAAGGAALVVLAFGFDRLNTAVTQQSALRLYEVIELGLTHLGPVLAWPIAVSAVATSAFSVLFGLGAGEYGWIAAFRAMTTGQGTETAQTFAFEFSWENPNNAGYLFRTNTWSSLLAEFGVIGFVALAGGTAVIAHGALRGRPVDRFDRNVTRVFTFVMVAVVFQGFFTPFSNWSESILMFPLMYMGAYLVGRDESTAAWDADETRGASTTTADAPDHDAPST